MCTNEGQLWSCGMCAAGKKQNNCLLQMYLDVVILLVVFGFLFTSFDENTLIQNLY